MPWEILDRAITATDNESRLYNSGLDDLVAAHGQTGIHTGAVVTAQATPNMTVAVSAGKVRIGGRLITTTVAASLAIGANASGNPRIDVVYVGTSGTPTVQAGTAAATPREPDLPGSSVKLARVYVINGATSIPGAQIADRRVVIPDPGFENVAWYGMVGNDSTDNTAAMNLALAAIPTASPIIGREVLVPPGVYRFGTATTMPAIATFGVKFRGLGGKPTNQASGTYAATGAIFRLTAGFRLFDFNAGAFGAVNSQNGPTFENLGFDGQGIAATEAIRLRMVNRATFRSCAFAGFRNQALQFDSAVDTVAGGDCSWHNLFDCTFYNCTIGIWARHTFGINIYGGDVVCFNAAYVGFRFSDAAHNNPSQHVHIFGVMFDGGNPAIDFDGAGMCRWYGCKFEVATIGVRIVKGLAGTISGNKNRGDGCAFGSTTTAFVIGATCLENDLGSNHYSSVTTIATFGDAAGTQSTYMTQPPLWPPGNMPLDTIRSSVPADADMSNGQMVIYVDPASGNAHLKAKIKDATGTTVIRTL